MENVWSASALPSSRGGVDAAIIKWREATLTPRPGWSEIETSSFSDHPVCAARELGHFITGAATPPLEEGSAEAGPRYVA